MAQIFLFLILLPYIFTENTSEDNTEGSGQLISLAVPVVNRFSPDNSALHTGRQILRDITDHGKEENVSDQFYEEYLYDDDVTEANRKEELVQVTNIERTTMPSSIPTSDKLYSLSTEQQSSQLTTTSNNFATLLVDEVTSSPLTIHNTKLPLKLVRLNDGDLIHKKGQPFHDQSRDEFVLKKRKHSNWRDLWAKIPSSKRTIVSNDVGGIPENLPPPPPGAQLIYIFQSQVRSKRSRTFQKNTNKTIMAIEDLEKKLNNNTLNLKRPEEKVKYSQTYNKVGKRMPQTINEETVEEKEKKDAEAVEAILNNNKKKRNEMNFTSEGIIIELAHHAKKEKNKPVIYNTATLTEANMSATNQSREKFELALKMLNQIEEEGKLKDAERTSRKNFKSISEILYDPLEFDFIEKPIIDNSRTTHYRTITKFSHSRLGPNLKVVPLRNL